MTPDALTASDAPSRQALLQGERIMLIGRLSGMPRAEAIQAIGDHGGELVELSDQSVTLAVLGDEHANVAAALGKNAAQHQWLLDAVTADDVPTISESELWRRVGMADDCQVRRLYTPAMLAEMIGIPAAAIRHWRRVGALCEVRCVGRLPYFDFEEAAIAKRLGQLHAAGCSLRTIDRRLDELARLLPGVERPIADASIVVEGRRLLLRRGEELSEPSGQRLLAFDDVSDGGTTGDGDSTAASVLKFANVLPAKPFDEPYVESYETEAPLALADQLEQEALDWIDAGELARAAESYRTILMASGPSAETLFSLADVLYRSGDLPAARERFYAVLELDEEFVEARANLGCVLDELGELELAVSAFEGALQRHPDFADVHFHMAGTLDQLHRSQEAALHYRIFLSLAPESPWAVAARDRLAQFDDAPSEAAPALPFSS